MAHYLISFRTYEVKRFPVWWDCASLFERVGSGRNKFVPMFYTFPRCFSSKHFNPQFFSGACRTSHEAPVAARESSRMFLFTDPNVFSAFALCSARKAPFLSEKLLAGWQSRSCDNQAIPFARAIAYFLSPTVR